MSRDPIQIERSRELRRNATVPEARLWKALRDRRLGAVKFRRQHAIGPFIADFHCMRLALVIELAGDSHIGRAAYDANRQRYLEALGPRVLRMSNDDVLGNLEGVMDQIDRECRDRRPLSPLNNANPGNPEEQR